MAWFSDKPWKRWIIVLTLPIWVFPALIGLLLWWVIEAFLMKIRDYIKYG